MIFTKSFDIHSIIHFVGCYALVPTLMTLFSLSGGIAAGLTIALAVGWEMLDELNYILMWKNRFLDPRGADVFDIIVSLAGILLAFLIF